MLGQGSGAEEYKQLKFDILSEALGNVPTVTLDKADIEAAARTLAAARG